MKACVPSQTLCKAQDILGNWEGRGFFFNFYSWWLLCPKYSWWLSSPLAGLLLKLLLPIHSPLFCSIVVCTWKLGRAELLMGQKSEGLSVEKQVFSRGLPQLSRCGSQSASAHPRNLFLSSFRLLPPPNLAVPGKHFPTVPLCKADGSSFPVIVSLV